jgi:hypothetical protein
MAFGENQQKDGRKAIKNKNPVLYMNDVIGKTRA